MIIVYTAILGTCDSLKPAPAGADRCVCFVDNPADYPDAKGWELVKHVYTGDPRREAWRLRCVPHELFRMDTTHYRSSGPESVTMYDRVIWIDASFTLTNLPLLLRDAGTAKVAAIRHHRRSDIYAEAAELVKVGSARQVDVDAQVAAYTKAGYRSTVLSISCIVVRDNSEQARRFSETWDDQIRNFLGDNTQLSIDFAAWANAFAIHPLRGTRLDNPYAVHDGADHKKRRRPYQVPA